MRAIFLIAVSVFVFIGVLLLAVDVVKIVFLKKSENRVDNTGANILRFARKVEVVIEVLVGVYLIIVGG